MRHLPLPSNQNGQQYVAGEVARICIGAIQQPQEFIDRITPIIPNIVAAENQYSLLASGAGLHNFPREGDVNGPNGVVKTDELKRLYSYRLLNEGQPGRAIYEHLRDSAGNTCPLCGIREVRTLDHHLPQSEYPIICVAPFNLVPACRDCQFEKMEDFPTTAACQTLHPYYDNVDTEIWLTAVVNQTHPATFSFGVTPPNSWTALMADRVRHHMNTLELPRLFAFYAANELIGIRQTHTALLHSGGMNAVRADLQSRAEGWRTGGLQAGRLNSWQLAMYQAAATDDWFCNGGFAAI